MHTPFSHRFRSRCVSVATTALAALILSGSIMVGDATAQSQCSGPYCDGLNPYDTTCVWDGQLTPVGAPIVDPTAGPTGRQIGGIGLYYSPSCQTVWAATAFYEDQDFRVCTVRRRATGNDASCLDYDDSRGNVAPMKYVPSGKTAFGRVVVKLPGREIKVVTPDYTAS